MSASMWKEILETEVGLKAFGKYLAEDYFMAQAVQDRYLLKTGLTKHGRQ